MFFTLVGVTFTTDDKDDMLREVAKYLGQKRSEKPLVIFTPNPEQLVFAQKDEAFRKLLNSADVVLPDGVGVVWAVKKLTTYNLQPTTELKRIPGIEFMEELIKLAALKDYPVAFIGGRGEVAQMALLKLREKYPGLEGWAEEGPEVEIQNSSASRRIKIQNENAKEYFAELTEKLVQTETRLLFVGLGAPKQEYFIQKIKDQRSKIKDDIPLVLMSVGGAFDVLSGKVPRAPTLVRIMNLEWLWRLLREPWRLKRQLRLVEFVWLVIRAKMSGTI